MRTQSRRPARELALRTLYECEVGGSAIDEVFEVASLFSKLPPALEEYAKTLVHGVADHQDELDAELSRLLVKYDLMRLATLDRNILRLAAYEIDYTPDVPARVTINEAIEIAKKFSTAESGRFINGVLGKFVEEGSRKEKLSLIADPVEEEVVEEEEPEVEEQIVQEGSPEEAEVRKLGAWKVRSEN